MHVFFWSVLGSTMSPLAFFIVSRRATENHAYRFLQPSGLRSKHAVSAPCPQARSISFLRCAPNKPPTSYWSPFLQLQQYLTDTPPQKLHLARKFNVPANAPRAETGALDYLTEGLSPNGGRRMSTSSVGSSRAGGAGGDRDRDRDSLLSNQAQQQQERDSADSSDRSSGGGGGGGGGGDDAASSSTRGEVCNAFVAGVWLAGHRSEGVVGCGARGRVSGCRKFVVAGKGMGLGCVEIVLIVLGEQHYCCAVAHGILLVSM